jgi:hypothetical protein
MDPTFPTRRTPVVVLSRRFAYLDLDRTGALSNFLMWLSQVFVKKAGTEQGIWRENVDWYFSVEREYWLDATTSMELVTVEILNDVDECDKICNRIDCQNLRPDRARY